MKVRVLMICWVVVAMISSCGQGYNSSSLQFTESLYVPEYANGFEVLGSEGAQSSLLRITRPWQGERVESYELLILRDGEVAPQGYDGAVICEKAERIIALSSSNVAMFDRLGMAESIVGLSGVDYISSPNIQKLAAEKKLHDVGYDTALNYELLTVLRPDIVLLYSVAGANNGVTSKLDELNIPYLYIGDYAEESPLGKAEWLVAMGEICGERINAEELFKQSAAKYNELKKIATDVVHRPKVMLNTPYRDVWYMPSSKSYMVQLIDDAGGDYIYDGNNTAGTKAISVEEAYKLATSAEYWLNTGATINSMGDQRSQVPKFISMPVVKSGGVYNNTARSTPMGGSDFWESGVVYPELVLQDLIEIFHPELCDAQLYYYKQLK